MTVALPATGTAQQQQRPFAPRVANPWASDHVLLSLSVWWVQSTLPGTIDFRDEVAHTFTSLRKQLQ